MAAANFEFEEPQTDQRVPERLKQDLLGEIDTVRNTMHIVVHFSQHLLTALAACLPVTESSQSTD